MSEQVQWVGILELFNVTTMRRHPAVWVVFFKVLLLQRAARRGG